MRIGVVRESGVSERRVALVPDGAGRLIRSGLQVEVQRGAGNGADLSDDAYTAAGATLVDAFDADHAPPDVVVRVGRPGEDEIRQLGSNTVLIGLLQAANSADLLEALAARSITALSLERIPRIARAQSMDVVSSQSSVSGYRAVLIGASTLRKFFPMMITAAGTIPPARVLVMGTGVAGLQAIATARRLGAVVQGYDIRPAAKEQVESLGATFVSPRIAGGTETAGGYAAELSQDAQEREREAVLHAVSGSDVVITTALIPGRPAPVLISEDMVRTMTPGSVIVDIAAEAGGNCELTQPGETIISNGVTIVGPLNLPSTLSVHASQMYSRNLTNLLDHIIRDGKLMFDFEDPIIDACCITHAGEVRHGLGHVSPVAAHA